MKLKKGALVPKHEFTRFYFESMSFITGKSYAGNGGIAGRGEGGAGRVSRS